MGSRTLNIIIWLLLVSSVLIFDQSYFKYQEYKEYEINYLQQQESLYYPIPLELEKILKTLSRYEINNNTPVNNKVEFDSSFAVLFILNTGVCSASILEVHEHIDVLGSYNNYLKPYVVVLDEDSVAANYFLQRSGFEAPSYFGEEKTLSKVTRLYENNPPINQLLAIIDLSKSQVVYRNIISTRITSLSYKHSLIDNVIKPTNNNYKNEVQYE
jgi:hypothetical protein